MAGLLESLHITKTSEGFGRPGGESDLPIDVNYAKLVEWLADRNQLPADWRKRLRLIQAKAAELPSPDKGGDADPPLDYFTARAERDHLAETAERNLLGQLKGAAGSWQQVVSAYEKGGVWLGEAAMTLTRNVDFEVPALRKAAARAQQQLVDLQRRREEYLHSASTAAAAYTQECRDLGIEGRNVEAELRGLGGALSEQLSAAVGGCGAAGVAEALRYYAAFTAYAHALPDSGGSGSAGAAEVLPSLRAVQAGEVPPGTVLEPPAGEETGQAGVHAQQGAGSSGGGGGDPTAPAEISWDIDLSAAAKDAGDSSAASEQTAAPAGISWDIDMAAADSAAADSETADTAAATVDWDVEMDGAGAGDDAGSGMQPTTIDWDLSVDDSGTGEQQTGDSGGASSTAAAGAGAAESDRGGAAADPLVAALMDSSDARARLMDDLHELQAFLTQRSAQLASGAGEALSASAPEAVQVVGESAVGEQLAAVEGAIAALAAERLKQLLLVRGSRQHRARLARHLQQAAAKEAKFQQAAEETAAKRVEMQRRLMGYAPKLAALLRRTAMIQREVEAALSAANGRAINVIGEINTVLGTT